MAEFAEKIQHKPKRVYTVLLACLGFHSVGHSALSQLVFVYFQNLLQLVNETVLPNQAPDQYGTKLFLQVNLSRIGRAFDNARRCAFICDAEFAVELLIEKEVR